MRGDLGDRARLQYTLGCVDIYVRSVRNYRGEVPSPIDQRGLEPPNHTG